PDADAVLVRLEHLRRALAPEHEFSLILSWLGQCRLVHRMVQEQLPLNSTETLRVPDLVAAFEYKDKLVPVLIEVKSTAPADPMTLNEGVLHFKPHYLRYAELMRLPLLIAWRHRVIWTMFDARCAELGPTNLKIGFCTAMKENLLG